MTETGLAGQFIGWALSSALGILLVRIVLGRSCPVPRWLTLFVSPGLGFGISSLIWFVVWCRGGSGSTLVPLSAEFCVLLVFTLYVERTRGERLQRTEKWRVRWLFLPILFSLGCALYHYERFLRAGPYGGWDAWAIWNLHARAFFTGGGRIWKTELFKLPWSHPDYPLLIPLTVARFWFLTGREVPSAPALVATYYTFAAAGVIGATLNYAKGPLCAALGAATVLASNQFLWVGFQEYADVPISLYILMAFAFLTLSDLLNCSRLIYLAGFSAGLAAWTKNEGFTFLICLVAAQFLTGRPLRIAGRICAGAAVPVAITLAYKRRIPAQSDVLSWLATKGGWLHAFDLNRLCFLFRGFSVTLWKLDTWLISSAAVLILYFLLAGPEREADRRGWGVLGLLTTGLLFLTYFAVYATSPTELPALQAYLDSSLSRLYVQVWPAFVLCFFLVSRTPFESRAFRTTSHPQ